MSNEQMIAVLECFIHHKTNQEVRIQKPRTPSQYLLLSKCYENCIGLFIK